MGFRDDQKLAVQQATDIVALISQHLALRARGREFLGLCPFHEDKNPSLNVSPSKQIYKCFSCGAGGDAFSFVMNYHKMTFPEAMEYLAQRAGIKLVRTQSHDDPQGPTDRQRIADANTKALTFFRSLYRHAEHGRLVREYVQRRGINDAMLEAFALGYAPDRWDGLVTMIRERGWSPADFELAGLISPRSQGEGYFDKLRHRLIFPIYDSLNRPIAFGGRKLREEDEPKYLNSPETVLFNKSATLYGLHLAKKPIIDSHTAVIVEGYTDVIACHQAGVSNVVATLGTALTPQHITELRRYCEKVVLIYDADEAGQKAADRAVETFITGDLDVMIAVLPDELDPAELFEQTDGLARWHATIAAACDALAFQFARVKQQLQLADTLTGRQRLTEQYLQRLAQMGIHRMNILRRTLVIQRLADLLKMPEQQINELLSKLKPAPRPNFTLPNPTPAPTVSTTGQRISNPTAEAGDENFSLSALASTLPLHKIKALARAEQMILGCLMREAALFHRPLSDGRTLDESLAPQDLFTPQAHALYGHLLQRLSQPQEISLQRIQLDLAAQDQLELSSYCATCEHTVSQAMNDQPDRLIELFGVHVEALLHHHHQPAYQHARTQFLQAQADRDAISPAENSTPPPSTADAWAPQLTQQLRKPNPTRIARLKSST